MKKRLIFGLLAAAIFVPILVMGGVAFDFLIGLLAMLAVTEFFKMRGLEFFSFEGVFAMLAAFVLAVPMGNYFTALPLDGSLSTFSLLVLFILSGIVFTFPKYRLEDAAFPIAISFYVGFGFQQLITARQAGLEKALLALTIIWATDIGAYTIGVLFGRSKLAPNVSPNKSVEGFLGGILSAVIAAAIFLLVQSKVISQNLWSFLPLVALFSVLAQFGDLVESAIKRQYGVKDSGMVIPGHGGIFDRFDSLIFVLPVMHLFGLF